MSSLIPADNDFALWAVLFGIAAFGFWIERYPFGRKYSGVTLLITLGILLSNTRVIPTQAPVYDAVWSHLVPVAIPLLLFQANLWRVFREAGKTLIAFAIGSATVIAGVLIGLSLFELGPEEAKLGGIFTGTYIGGSLNFAAVAAATEFADESLLIAAVAADNIITNLHVVAIILLPGLAWFARLYPDRDGGEATAAVAANDEPVHRIADFDVVGLLAALAVALGMAAAGGWFAALIERPQYAILVTSLLAVTLATVAPALVEKTFSGYTEAGTALLFVFLASIGASADVWRLLETAPIFFLFAFVVVGVHFVLLLLIGRVTGLSLGEVCVASAVCVGGPASGPAIASARGWSHLLVPGVLAGSFGYAVGSFVGITVWEWLR